MHGGTLTPVQRPADGEFYCVMVVEDMSGGNHPEHRDIAPGKGGFEEMLAKARGILANKPYVTQVQVCNKGNFWHREVRQPYCTICESTKTEPAFEHDHLMVTSGF